MLINLYIPGRRRLTSRRPHSLAGNTIRLCRGHRRRTSWKHNSLVPGTKKEDVLDGQFAYPVDKEGGLPGEDFLEGLCYLGTKEDFLQTQFACAGDKEFAHPQNKGGFPGNTIRLCREQRRRISCRANLLIPATKMEEILPIRLRRGQRRRTPVGQFAFAYPGCKEG